MFQGEDTSAARPQSHAPCWMNLVIVRGVHWVRLVPVLLLTCYQALQHQHTCIQIHLTVIKEDSIWDRHTCLLPWETSCHGGSLFTGNGRLVQRYQGSQVPLPTGGLPRGK